MKKKRAALYMRVSSGEQNTEAQERALREYVRRRDWTIHRVYRDQGPTLVSRGVFHSWYSDPAHRISPRS